MRLSRCSILIISYITCLGFYPTSVAAVRHDQATKILNLASVNSTGTVGPLTLRLGSSGEEVKVLQTKLKQLGYYNNVIDGVYGDSTNRAVSEFQGAKGLTVDGVYGKTTRKKLEEIASKKLLLSSTSSFPPESKIKHEGEPQSLIWWLVVSMGALGVFGGFLFLIKQYGNLKKVPQSKITEIKTSNSNQTKPATPYSQQSHTTTPPTTELLPLETTSRLTKVNIVDELMNDLHSLDPTQRRKAIWDLGQQGDSRAIQPLVDLMIEADSQQRSLILAALAEIGIRTLKPMNRALATSLQDESPQVRQNAIRDLTRVYDSLAQVSQMLSHAAQDSDVEVQGTARYALSQMNRIRALPTQEIEEDQQKQTDGEIKNS